MIVIKYTIKKDGKEITREKTFDGKNKDRDSVRFLERLNDLKMQLAWRKHCQINKLNKKNHYPNRKFSYSSIIKNANGCGVFHYPFAEKKKDYEQIEECIPFGLSVSIRHE